MKRILLLSILFCCTLVKAQGPQQLVDVPYAGWPGATVKGWLYLPADYNTSTKNYPVVFFYHGVGEAGTNPYTVLNQGLPNLIAGGMRPDNITNPEDGQKYSFIVLSVQHWAWSPGADWLPYELQWLKQNYRVDTNRVYVTGLSAGGQSSFATTVNNYSVSRLIAAAVPMSPAAVNGYDPSLIGQNKIHTWFFSGNVDGGYTANATTYSTDCNVQFPGSSSLSIYSGGHCCWNTFYNTAWRDASSGQSIWEWMLRSTRVATTSLSEPMPVNFKSIRLEKAAEGVNVIWEVADEQNVDRYEVEKSADGKSFVVGGSVKANGSTHYHFEDNLPASYYRVKSVDRDGKLKYTTIVTNGQVKTGYTLKAYPMPAQTRVTLQHPVSATHGRITLQAADGRLLRIIQPEAGSFETEINIGMEKPGLYIIKYEDGSGGSGSIKIAKQ